MLVGLQMSRRNTIDKILNLVQKMQVKGLWLTYRQLESCGSKRQRTKPIRDNNKPSLQPPYRSFNSGQSQVIYKNEFDETPIRPAKHQIQPAQSLIRKSLISLSQTRQSKSVSKLGDKAFTIVGNNSIEPNFESEFYKSQASEAFKRRMTYNPREQSKPKTPLKSPVISRYSQIQTTDVSKSAAQLSLDRLKSLEKVNSNSMKNLTASMAKTTDAWQKKKIDQIM